MSLSLVQSRALLGLEAASVTVEVHLANGLPSFTLVGLVETEVKEARERVRSAIQNAGLEFPNNKRITVNLAPADLPKDSGRFDLPMAMAILAASGQIDNARLAGHEFAGELSLSGELRPVRGALDDHQACGILGARRAFVDRDEGITCAVPEAARPHEIANNARRVQYDEAMARFAAPISRSPMTRLISHRDAQAGEKGPNLLLLTRRKFLQVQRGPSAGSDGADPGVQILKDLEGLRRQNVNAVAGTQHCCSRKD